LLLDLRQTQVFRRRVVGGRPVIWYSLFLISSIAMPTQQNNAVRVSHHAKARKKSRPRAQFDTLIQQLEAERKRLAAWHDAIPLMRARANAELMPVSRQHKSRCKELAILFDKACGSKQITKRERAKLSDLICGLAFQILETDQDEELSALLEKHSWGDDEDLKDDPDYAAFSEIVDGLLSGDFEIPEDEGPHMSQHKSQANKPKSHKETAREERQAAEEQRLQQSVRDIFRKLTSSLHPDREQDPAERERKTALMQRVNVAYTNNDLLGLLELQFEIDQIDPAALASLPEERIKQYNKLLTRQVDEVRRDIAELEYWLIYEMGLPVRGRIRPSMLEKSLYAAIGELRARLAVVERDLRDFQDIKVLKAFLKTYRISDTQAIFDDGFF
jgi:hypothetical protein